MKTVVQMVVGVLFVLGSSVSAKAATYAGHWVLNGGQMQAKYLGQAIQTTACTVIDMQMSVSDTELKIDSYHAKCGTLDSKWGPYPMELRGQEVYTDNEKAGTFDGSKLDVRLEGGYYLRFELNGNTLKTLYGATNIVQSIEIGGELELQPSVDEDTNSERVTP